MKDELLRVHLQAYYDDGIDNMMQQYWQQDAKEQGQVKPFYFFFLICPKFLRWLFWDEGSRQKSKN